MGVIWMVEYSVGMSIDPDGLTVARAHRIAGGWVLWVKYPDDDGRQAILVLNGDDVEDSGEYEATEEIWDMMILHGGDGAEE